MRFPHLVALAAAIAASAVLVSASVSAQAPAAGSGQATALDDLARVQRWGELLSRRVMIALDEARRSRNPIRVQCLDRSLSQVHSTLRELERRAERVARGRRPDSQMLRHDLSVVRVLGRRFGELEQEARVCNGEVAAERSRTLLVVTIDPEVPREDPTRLRREGDVSAWVPPPGPL
jgi:hypothetical protein